MQPDFTAKLLAWYDTNRRMLPWRGSRDPYVIWVSEIIFQQTRIDQGTGYYLRFVGRFPDLPSLASATEDEVLKVWQGLGYYSRARNMLSAARTIMADFNGLFPRDFDSVRALKGVGDYTASCIASICFGQPHAALDGNVYRVLSRSKASHLPIDSTEGRRQFKAWAQELISSDRPGDFNEAMMDLGAMICKPANPACEGCPVNSHCKAFASGTVMDYPVRGRKPDRKSEVLNYLLIRSEKDYIIRKRTGPGIWNGLYELPSVPGNLGLQDLAREFATRYGIDPGSPAAVRQMKHPLSHADLHIRFYQTDALKEPVPDYGGLIRVSADELPAYPFPKPLADFLGENLAKDSKA